MASFSGVTFGCFASFFFNAFVEAAVLCSIVLQHAGVPIATRDVAFPEYFFSLYGEYVVRSFLSDGVFYLVAQCLGETFSRYLFNILKKLGGVCVYSQTGIATPCGAIFIENCYGSVRESYYTFKL